MAKPFAKLAVLLTPKRRRAQFSLATMFVVVTLLCVWLAWEQSQASRQRRAVKRIKELGGFIAYAHEYPDGQRGSNRIPNAEPPGP